MSFEVIRRQNQRAQLRRDFRTAAGAFIPGLIASAPFLNSVVRDIFKMSNTTRVQGSKELPHYGRKKRKRSKSTARRTAPTSAPKPSRSASIKTDGTSAGKTSTWQKAKTKGKRSKPSMKEQIAQVRKLIPKTSTKLFRDFKFIRMGNAAENERRIFNIRCFDKTIMDSYASRLSTQDTGGFSDYSTDATTSLHMNQFFKLIMRVGITANVKVRWQFCICKVDSTVEPVADIKKDLETMGYDPSGTLQAKTDGSTTVSEQPAHLRLTGSDEDPFHAPWYAGTEFSRHWETVGKMHEAILGPGDQGQCVWSRNDFIYKQQTVDDSVANTELARYSVFLIIDVCGTIGHDNQEPNLVGYGQFKLDCEEQRQCLVKYANARGLREVEYAQDMAPTKVYDGNIVAADNFNSAIEAGNIQ